MKNILVLLPLLAFVGCSHIERKAQEPSAVRVTTVVVQPQATEVHSRYVGEITAGRETPLSIQTTGRILMTGCRDGERVRKGQVLLRVDSVQSLNALRSAEASLRHAQDGYDRAKQVHSKGGVTDQQMVEIESQLTQAKSMYSAAKRGVEECTLRAPFDGVISGFDLSVGQTVVPGMPLFSVLDISSLSVRFGVPEGEITRLTEHKGEVEVPAAGVVLPIRISEKSVSANPITHSYAVTADITGDIRGLMPGMVGKVTLRTRNAEEIIIPAHCVQLMPDGPTVWVVSKGAASRRSIGVSGYCANGVQVNQGLQTGDTLVVEGYQKLYKGCKVLCE